MSSREAQPVDRPRTALILVRNTVSHDNRVLREVQTLRRGGFSVLVAGVVSTAEPQRRTRVADVEVIRIDPLAGLHRRGRARERVRARGRRGDGAAGGVPAGQAGVRAGGAGVRARLRRLAVTTGYYVRGAALCRRTRPALVHANDYNTMWIALAAKLLCGSRVVYDCHELWPDRNGRPEWRPWLVACEALFVRAADVTITASPGYAEEIARRYRVRRPVVVRNIPDVSPLGPSAGVTAPDPTLAVYLGGVMAGRGLEQGIEALARVPELRMRLVGPGRDAYRAGLLRLAERLGVADRLQLVPAVAPGEVVAAIAPASFGLMLIQPVCRSYELTLPNKLFEYAAGRGADARRRAAGDRADGARARPGRGRRARGRGGDSGGDAAPAGATAQPPAASRRACLRRRQLLGARARDARGRVRHDRGCAVSILPRIDSSVTETGVMGSGAAIGERRHSRRAVLGMLGTGVAAGVGAAGLLPSDAEAATRTFTGAVNIFGVVPTDVQLIVRAAPSQSANLVQFQQSSGAKLIVVDSNGHIGIGNSDPKNASVYVGSGTGSLTDRQGSGLEVKIDTSTSGEQPDGIRANVRVVPGTPSTSVRGMLAQLDVDGGLGSGRSDCVALWGETFVTSASPSAAYRDTWGLNTDVEIFPLPNGAVNPYAGAAVGAEIGVHNGGGTLNDGGPLTLVSQGYKVNGTGDNSVAFGAMISSGTGTRVPDRNAEHQIHCNILMPSNDGRAPSRFAIYYGATAPGNIPQYDRHNPPFFAVDALGHTFVQRLGVGNAIAAHNLGTLIGAWPIYTDPGTGVVAGYVPIYDRAS